MTEHIIKGLYIHVPFCVSKCAYCAFYSEPNISDSVKVQYTTRLIKDIKKSAINIDKDDNVRFGLQTLYFGGGTPSTLSLSELRSVIDSIEKTYNIQIDELIERTIEINPGTVDREYLKGLKELGFNRISIGIQTLQDHHLKTLGRIHTSRQAIEALELLKEVGFENVSVDLMFGLPNQTLDDIRESIDTILSFDNVKHISAYSLIIEENTPLKDHIENRKLILPSEEDEREMQYFINDYLRLKGFKHYEISNYALSGYEAVHNSLYWTLDDYIGLGPGASSFINNTRIDDHSNIWDYINGTDESVDTFLCDQEILKEDFIILGLRRLEGIDPEVYKSHFSSDLIEDYGQTINDLIDRGLLENVDERIRLTAKGLDLANQVFIEFVKI